MVNRWNEAHTAYNKTIQIYPIFATGYNNSGMSMIDLATANKQYWWC